MEVKTYQALSMAEALAAVKLDLGHDALILHTRSFRRGGLLGLGRRTVVEVTATPAEPAAARVAPPARALPATAAARRAYAAGRDAAAHDQEPRAPEPRPAERRATEARPSQERSAEGDSTPREPAPLPARSPVARRFILQPAGSAATAVAPRSEAADDVIERELSAIRRMVGQVLRHQTLPAGTAERPALAPPLVEPCLRLVAEGLPEEEAEEILEGVPAPQGDAADEAALRAAILERLASMVPIADPPLATASPDARPLTVALVGPTGVGKTTTLAKLAATLHIRQGRRVGLVTADTYRIAAVEQLRTYANILGLPLQVALSPADMRQSIQALGACDVVLIDTAGRSQNDAARLDELRRFLGAAEPHEVHLVLSASAGAAVLRRAAEAFAVTGPQRLILSKLDEAATFGAVFSAVRHMGRPLSYFTTGQEVPDDIEPAAATRLAGLLYPERVLHG